MPIIVLYWEVELHRLLVYANAFKPLLWIPLKLMQPVINFTRHDVIYLFLNNKKKEEKKMK